MLREVLLRILLSGTAKIFALCKISAKVGCGQHRCLISLNILENRFEKIAWSYRFPAELLVAHLTSNIQN